MKQTKKVISIVLALVLVLSLSLLPETSISAAPKKVKLNKTKVTINVGKTVTLKLKNNKKTVKWSTSNKKVAIVTKKGKVTGKKAGKATITAKVGKKKYKCKVIVKQIRPAYAVKISNNLDANSAYDKISITIENTGTETIYLGNYTDLQEKYMTVYNALAGSILYQSNVTGYCLISATTILPGNSKTLEFTRLYSYKSDFQWYKTFHLCNASYFEIPIYSNYYVLHTEKCYVN